MKRPLSGLHHGGRGPEAGCETIDILPEVLEAVGSHIPVFVDDGFRRGTDAYGALAISARTVWISRAYIFGLASFGQEGVERVTIPDAVGVRANKRCCEEG
jgi:isopentenyl diphosphate isomerase/L-lactate dehydrogenase-like FMN-dependent dehydrogenase